MPPYIEDVPFVKIKLLGAILASIAYGIVIVLSGNCFHLLQKRDIYSNRMRILLLIYVIIMLLCSTWMLLGSIYELMYYFTPPLTSFLSLCSFGAFTMAMWGADGFMIWRCLILYQSVSRSPRIVIIVLLSILSLASVAFGVMVLVGYVVFDIEYRYQVFTSLSALANIILAALIISRLVYHRRHVRNTLGVEHGSPYTNVITMCVESSALMVIVSGLYSILGFVSPQGETIMFDIIPHIYVISPLLIVYRVALGRAIPPTLLPSEQVMAQVRLSIPPSNPSGQEGEVTTQS